MPPKYVIWTAHALASLLHPEQGMKRLIALAVGLAAVLLLLSAIAFRTVEPKVHLVPLEAPPELMRSLQGYYQRELALNVDILPAVQITSRVWNEQRGQVIAERVAELIDAAFRESTSQNAIIIGITGRDLYIENRAWQFAFSSRHGGRRAIVSYARMGLSPHGRADADLVESRVRKMVTRNIGVMRYRLPLSPERDHLMYESILGLDDLDFISEDLHRAGFPGATPRPSRENGPETLQTWNRPEAN